VKCQTCKDAGLKSKLSLVSALKDVGEPEYFYDKDGKNHVHDTRLVHLKYLCENGHETLLDEGPKQCPQGWPGAEP